MTELPINVKNYFCNKFNLNINKITIVKEPKLYSDGFVYYANDFVLKVMKIQEYRVSYIELIDKRVEYVLYLNNFMENVIHFRKSIDGSYTCCIFYKNEYYIGFLMDRIQGIHLKVEDLEPNIIKKWGKETALMNKFSINFDSNLKQKLLAEGRSNGWINEWQMFDDICDDKSIEVEWKKVRDELSSLEQNIDNFGYTHNDNSAKNILVSADKINFIDFDVSNYNWFVNDLAIPIFNIMEEIGGVYSEVHNVNFLQSFIDNFIEGYLSEWKIDKNVLKAIDIFLDYRRILYYIVMKKDVNRPELGNLYQYIIKSETMKRVNISKLMSF